jgi:hypothetical protein
MPISFFIKSNQNKQFPVSQKSTVSVLELKAYAGIQSKNQWLVGYIIIEIIIY